jgi:predicted nucleic acid-binding protein
MRCLLQRRRRAGDIEHDLAQDIWLAFQEDIAAGILLVYPILDSHMFAAAQLIEQLSQVPLRTLDALHLAVAQANAVEAMATADLVMKRAAKALKLQLVEF